MTRLRVVAALTVLTVMAVWLAVPRPVSVANLVIGGTIGGVLIFLGLAAAARFAKGAPLIQALAEGRRPEAGVYGRLLKAALVGLLVGGVLLIVLVFVLVPLEPAVGARLQARVGAPLWLPLALAVESSILEEVFFRLFLLSAVAWLVGRAWREGSIEIRSGAVWVAVSVSALAFGLAHVPSWQAAVTLTPVVIGTVLLLNGVAGIVLGQIYWRWGIEAAIACHFAADLIVQGVGPRLMGLVVTT